MGQGWTGLDWTGLEVARSISSFSFSSLPLSLSLWGVAYKASAHHRRPLCCDDMGHVVDYAIPSLEAAVLQSSLVVNESIDG